LVRHFSFFPSLFSTFLLQLAALSGSGPPNDPPGGGGSDKKYFNPYFYCAPTKSKTARKREQRLRKAEREKNPELAAKVISDTLYYASSKANTIQQQVTARERELARLNKRDQYFEQRLGSTPSHPRVLRPMLPGPSSCAATAVVAVNSTAVDDAATAVVAVNSTAVDDTATAVVAATTTAFTLEVQPVDNPSRASWTRTTYRGRQVSYRQGAEQRLE
jgi:hypothetical protein